MKDEETVDIACNLHYHTIKNKKVEVKKAQPKDSVMSANTAALLGRRLVMLPAPQSSPTPTFVNLPLLQPALQQPINMNQIGEVEDQKMSPSFINCFLGKILPSSGSSVRYSPYQTLTNTNQGLASMQHLQQLQPLQYTPSSTSVQQYPTASTLSGIPRFCNIKIENDSQQREKGLKDIETAGKYSAFPLILLMI